jgi:sterol O-acyltransferase
MASGEIDRRANGALDTPVSSPGSQTSEEDYDDISSSVAASAMERKGARPIPRLELSETNASSTISENSSFEALAPLKINSGGKVYLLGAEDKELKDIIRRGLQRAKDPGSKDKPRGRFRDLVFTRKFSAFDRQNEDAANSPFHGFYTLFWLAVFLFIIRIAAENWKKSGNPLGTNEIMRSMFRRDVIVLLLSDGIMCGLTGVSWVLQRLVFAGYLNWDRSGWIIQNVSSESLCPLL